MKGNERSLYSGKRGVVDMDARLTMDRIIQAIATGPTLSKDLSRVDARAGMRLVLERRVDDVQAAVFLIALRMKRETDEEMAGCLDAIFDGAPQETVDHSVMVTIAEPYTGYLRGLPSAPFVPAVLAALGVPSLTHGVHSMGPKKGLSHARILQACGLNVEHDLVSAAAMFEQGASWCYLDQSIIAPELHGLQELRDLIVKRPCLTTLESGLMPFRAEKNVLITGFVHKAYPPVYQMIAAEAGFDAAAVVRGVEGGIVPSLSQLSRYYLYTRKNGIARLPIEIDPEEAGIDCQDRAMPVPESLLLGAKSVEASRLNAMAVATATAGYAALRGEDSPMLHGIRLASAICLATVNAVEQTPEETSEISDHLKRVDTVLQNGSALSAFEVLRA